MTLSGTTAAIASAEGSHGPLKSTNTTSQSSANGSSMSTDHSLLVGVSQTPVQSSGGLSSNSTPPPSHSNSTQQLHAASATSTGQSASATSTGASMRMRAYYNFVADPELGGNVAARRFPTDNWLLLDELLQPPKAATEMNTQYQLDADSYDYYVCLTSTHRTRDG
jgi:hypothetical protein